jgi:hypothetical protein
MAGRRLIPQRWISAGLIVGLAAVAGLVAGAVGGPTRAGPLPHTAANGGPVQDEGWVAAAYVPFIVRRAGREQLTPPVTTTPSSTPTLTPTPTVTPSPTLTPTLTPTPEDCPPLDDRTSVTTVDVGSKQVQLDLRGNGWDRTRPVTLALAPDGSPKVAWADTSAKVWVTPLTADFERAGPDQSVDGTYIRGFVAHDDGAAVVVRRGTDDMYLVRLELDGTVRWETQIVGQLGQSVVDSKWVDSWGDEGRLAWTGRDYLLYLGHTQFFGAKGKHQGDLLRYYTADGKWVGNDARTDDWEWGCSHSLDLRLTVKTSSHAAACLSDCYFDKGMLFNDKRIIRPEPSGNCSGSSDAELGGLVAAVGDGEGYWFNYVSKETRRSHDVGLVHLSETGFKDEDLWLTDTAAVQETGAHLARHGANLFAAWTAGTKTLGAVVDPTGKRLEGPTDLGVTIGPRDDLMNLPNGDIAWAYAWGDLHNLRIVRVAFCSRQ